MSPQPANSEAILITRRALGPSVPASTFVTARRGWNLAAPNQEGPPPDVSVQATGAVPPTTTTAAAAAMSQDENLQGERGAALGSAHPRKRRGGAGQGREGAWGSWAPLAALLRYVLRERGAAAARGAGLDTRKRSPRGGGKCWAGLRHLHPWGQALPACEGEATLFSSKGEPVLKVC